MIKSRFAAALRGLGSREDATPYAEAERLLRGVLEAQPRHPEAAFNLGVLYLRNLDRRADAKAYLERAKKNAPSKSETYRRATELLEELR